MTPTLAPFADALPVPQWRVAARQIAVRRPGRRLRQQGHPSERIVRDGALHREPLGLGERFYVGRGPAEPGSGSRRAHPAERRDRLVADRLVVDVNDAAKEVFGPVAPVLSFADEDEAIELARDTDYGLSLGILGADVTRALALAEQIPARGRAAEDAGLSLRAPR